MLRMSWILRLQILLNLLLRLHQRIPLCLLDRIIAILEINLLLQLLELVIYNNSSNILNLNKNKTHSNHKQRHHHPSTSLIKIHFNNKNSNKTRKQHPLHKLQSLSILFLHLQFFLFLSIPNQPTLLRLSLLISFRTPIILPILKQHILPPLVSLVVLLNFSQFLMAISLIIPSIIARFKVILQFIQKIKLQLLKKRKTKKQLNNHICRIVMENSKEKKKNNQKMSKNLLKKSFYRNSSNKSNKPPCSFR